ncbi:MAG: hypothetical protein ABSD13_17280 [Candidatus Korobacteraceae bacterium]|jgi:hypothetical protein
MTLPEQLNRLVQSTTGPAPWFWETFPEVRGSGSRRYRWRFHEKQEGLSFLVTLHEEGEPELPRMALNTYCRPFPIEDGKLGVWCPEGRTLRFACFEPDRMQAFSLEEIAGWFAASSERIYATTPAQAEFDVSTELEAGTYALDVPVSFLAVDEVLAPCNYKGLAANDPSFAIQVVYPQAGLVEVLPQNWITRESYDVANHWITRVARAPETHRIVGELSRAGVFELEENGRDFSRWL